MKHALKRVAGDCRAIDRMDMPSAVPVIQHLALRVSCDSIIFWGGTHLFELISFRVTWCNGHLVGDTKIRLLGLKKLWNRIITDLHATYDKRSDIMMTRGYLYASSEQFDMPSNHHMAVYTISLTCPGG